MGLRDELQSNQTKVHIGEQKPGNGGDKQLIFDIHLVGDHGLFVRVPFEIEIHQQEPIHYNKYDLVSCQLPLFERIIWICFLGGFDLYKLA